MNNKQVVPDFCWECRKTKIELEHEVLLREMEVTLVAMIGLPITTITLVLQFTLWQSPPTTLIAFLLMAMGIVYLDDYRSTKKEMIKAKENELDKLILDINESSKGKP
jgi:hypothetical protein